MFFLIFEGSLFFNLNMGKAHLLKQGREDIGLFEKVTRARIENRNKKYMGCKYCILP